MEVEKEAQKTFNKIIDLEFYSDSKIFKIECPKQGRKPTILISGTILPNDNINNFEIKVTNLYLSDIQQFNKFKVTAGYESEKNTVIEGSIWNCYIESPAPDQVTVFSCVMGNIEDWISKTVDLKFKEGDSLSDILTSLTSALGFNTPLVAQDVTDTLKTPLNETGLAKDVFQTLKKSFSDVTITVDSNRFNAFKGKGTGKTYVLDYVSAPPQYQSNTVSVSALWLPALRCGDHFSIKTKYFSKDMSTKTESLKSEYEVFSLSFEFSTTGTENQMTIQGVAK